MRTKKEIKRKWLEYQTFRQECIFEIENLKCCNPDDEVLKRLKVLRRSKKFYDIELATLKWVLGETF